MYARITKEETALLINQPLSRSAREIEAIRLAAIEARDAAVGQAVKNALSTLLRGLRAAFVFVLEYPRRRAVFDQLLGMSDRELADIGLERADLGRVFDEDFALAHATASRRPLREAALMETARPEPANTNVRLRLNAAA